VLKSFLILLTGILLTPFFAKAQRTNVYIEPDAVFKNAYDLFTKQKYALAQSEFIKYNQNKPTNTLQTADATYYIAICANELFNEDAEDLLRNFILFYPESPKIKMAYFSLGNLLYRKKKYNESIDFYEKTETYDLTNEQLAEYYFKLGYSYFEEKKFDKALLNFTEIKDKDNRYRYPAEYYYSHICYLQKNYTTALTGFLTLTEQPQFSHIVPYYIAQLYYLQNNYEQVIAYAPALLDSANTKRAPEIARILGESYYKTNRFKEAIPYLIKYKEKGGAMLRNDYYQLAYAFYKAEEYTKAIDYFKDVTNEKDSLTQLTLYNVAECFLKINRKEHARSNFQACSKLNFDPVLREDAFFNYAKLAYELDYNPFDKAVIAFEAYLNEYPDSKRKDEAYKYLLNVYLSTRNYSAALESIEKIKQWTDDLKYAYQRIAYNRGVELYNNQDYKGSIELFNKSLKYPVDKPMGADAVYWKGEASYKLGNYTDAVAQYKEFIYQPGAALTPYFSLVNYNLGYAYYSLKEYNNAILWFRKFTGSKSETDSKRLNDAYLRTADSYFITKDYRGAFDNYQSASELKLFDTDYALLQKSIAAGLLGKQEEKEKGLKQLLNDFQKSTYTSDALYELGNYYLSKGESANAVTYFDRLNTEFPNSSYLKSALLKKGLVYKNSDQDAKAIEIFKQVAQNYQGTTEAKDAIYQIKLILLENGHVDEWESFAKTQNLTNISISELDSVSYDAANKKYSNSEWQLASESFENYLKKYPEGIFKIQATYYKAECDYKLNKIDEAFNNYNQFINWTKNKFTEPALLKASFIAMKKAKYKEATALYLKLEEIAEVKNNISDARIGLMRCYNLLGQADSLKQYSQKVMNIEKISSEIENEARYNLAKSLYTLKDTAGAMREYSDLADKANSETGANARYQLAEILFLKGNLTESEKNAYLIINHDPSYDYWVAKSFILLADILKEKQEFFQAKQTLQSIIDNFEGEELIKIARQKMEEIIELEKKNEQQKVREKIEINLVPEKGGEDKLFEDDNKKETPKEEEVKYE